MFKKVSENPNYLAKFVELPELKKVENSDFLQHVAVDGFNIITGLEAKEGDVYVVFPLESAINLDFLSETDSFSDALQNKDTSKKGFFGKHGRVKATKLRGMKSEGYMVPAITILEWLGVKEFDPELVGLEFDHYGDVKICEKYVNPNVRQIGMQNSTKTKAKKLSRVVEEQFRLSKDVAHLKRNVSKLTPESLISVDYKLHGCNSTLAKVLCKKKLSIVDTVAKFFGANVVTDFYDVVYASRRVIKNAYADQHHDHFYDTDVWAMMSEKYKHCLKDGFSLYGEMV